MIIPQNVFGRFVVPSASFGAGYDATVHGVANLLAYWRFNSAAAIIDETAGNRDGTFDGTVTLTGGLPEGSDQAVDTSGAIGTIPHDGGLALGAFTLSLWVVLHQAPATATAIVSKDQSGLNNGDFALIVDPETEQITAQFQSDAASIRVSAALPSFVAPHHLVVTAGGSGFELWIDGRHIGTSASWTGGWTANSQNLLFGSAAWATEALDMTIDEAAIYSRVLSDAEIILLSQRTGLPTTGSLAGLVVDEGATLTIDPTTIAGANYVGRKSALTIELGGEEDHGTASVVGGNIEYDAGAVSADEADSFTYTLADANGESAPGTIGLTVINAAGGDPGGGTLVYSWAPLATWIDGVPLSSRDGNDVNTLSRWKDGASVGSSLPKSLIIAGASSYCFNRAPTGEPALEIHVPNNTGAGSSVANLAIQLYDHLGAGAGPHPRHLRVVMEVKLCKPSDPTTYKGQGLGTTSGGYPLFRNCHDGANQVQMKYFCGTYAGTQPAGGGNACWWNDIALDISRAGYRMVTSPSGFDLQPYSYNFDRPNKGGGSQGSDNNTRVIDAGIADAWHRLEIEVRLCSAAAAEAANARRYSSNSLNTRPTGGDGYLRGFLTKNIDGTPGARTQVLQLENIIHFPWRDDTAANQDNRHVLCNLGGPFIVLIFGGSNDGSQAEGWAWLRSVRVYRHD